MKRPRFDEIVALATDGDGTLLRHKHIARSTARALDRWRMAGKRLILVTGEIEREVREFPDAQAFDLVVAENGALLYWPQSKKSKSLAPKCPQRFVRRLQRRRIAPLDVGKTVVGTTYDHAAALSEELSFCQLDWRLVRNRNRVMALPSGVDKSSGLCAALRELGLSQGHVIGVGDAENDVALLTCCGIGVAVRTAVAELKQCANIVAQGGPGRAIVEIVRDILGDARSRPTVRAG